MINIIGEYSGRLSNDGERVIISSNITGNIWNFTYNDQEPWPKEVDGKGPSLVFSGYNPKDPESWKQNSIMGGLPGYPDETVDNNNSLFLCGDLNNDEIYTVSDIVLLVNYILKIGERKCSSLADINKDNNIDISDIVILINYILGINNSQQKSCICSKSDE